MNESSEQSSFYLLAIFIAVSLLAFYPSAEAGFVFDFVGWAEHYKNGTYLEALNSFGYKGLHPVLHISSLTLTKLFGVKGVGWYLFMSSLHGLNAYVLYSLLKLIVRKVNSSASKVVPIIVAVLFLFHPYNIEPIVWRACVHYLISFFCIFSSLYFISRYFEEEKFKHYLWATLLYVIALFSLEISYITALLWFVLALTWNYLLAPAKYSIARIVTQFLLIPFSFLGIYLLLTYLKIGSAIGHYGAEKHLDFDFFIILNNAFDYLLKHLLFARDFKLYDTAVYHKLTSNVGLSAVLLTVLVFIFWSIFKSKSSFIKLTAVSLILFGIGLLPIVNLYFVKLLLSENDRYGYLAAPFLISALVLFFWNFKSKLKWIPVAAYLFISCCFFGNLIIDWHNSGNVYSGLAKNFNYFDKKEVILLNIPDNYNGIFMFRDIGNDGAYAFNETMDVIYDKKYSGDLKSVVQYSMIHPMEKFAIRSDSVNHIKVTFGLWGSWWMNQAKGAEPYENERLKLTLDPGGMSYDVKIKGDLDEKETVILYQESNEWKALDISAIKSSKPVKLNQRKGVY